MSGRPGFPAARRALATAGAIAAFALGGLSAQAAAGARPTHAPDNAAAQLGWQQRLGASLPLQLTFSDERGRVVSLARYFVPRRPVALVLMYLSCSRLCPLTLSLSRQAFSRAGLMPGRDFEMLAVSIDPYDGVAAAARRKAALAPDVAWQDGLHLLTAAPSDRANPQPAAARLAAAAGFAFLQNASLPQSASSPTRNLYAHPAGWLLVDPRGRISRYFFGLQYDPAELRQAVREAAAQAPPTWTQPLRLLCDCLVVLTGRYDGQVLNLLRLVCLAVLCLGGLWLWRQRAPASRSRRA